MQLLKLADKTMTTNIIYGRNAIELLIIQQNTVHSFYKIILSRFYDFCQENKRHWVQSEDELTEKIFHVIEKIFEYMNDNNMKTITTEQLAKIDIEQYF